MQFMASSFDVDVLILAAFAPELEGFRRVLGDGLAGVISGLSVACKTIGVGLPVATVGAIKRLIQMQPRAVVLVGTAGAYPGSGLSIGDVMIVRKSKLVSIAEVAQRAEFPEPMSVVYDCNVMLSLGISGGKAVTADVATTLAITTDDVMAAEIGECGFVGEHLEAFGVLSACGIQEVPATVVLGIANEVGSQGRAQWAAHQRDSAILACETVSRWLIAGAPGLPHKGGKS